MSTPLLPEFFALLGIDVFLAMSLLTCLLDKHFPSAIPYVYQLAALVGFGHLLVSRGFIEVFGIDMRFWYCIVYLLVAVANVIAANVYIAVIKRIRILALTLSGTVSFPTILLSFFFVSSYSNGMALSLPLLPLIPLQVVYVVLVLGAAVLGVGIVVSLKPGVLGKLRFRQPTKKVEDELTKVLEEVGERTEEGPEVSQAGKPEAVSKAGKPEPVSKAGKPEAVSKAGKPEPVSKAGKPEPVTPKSIRLTPETLKKIKRERR